MNDMKGIKIDIKQNNIINNNVLLYYFIYMNMQINIVSLHYFNSMKQ